MQLDARQPVIIGVAQYTDRPGRLEEAMEPLAMMELVARQAARDGGSEALLEKLDNITVVNLASWRYQHPPALLAERLGCGPRDLLHSAMGGDSPQRLMNLLAERIFTGRNRLALLVGAEAFASVVKARKEGVQLPWTPPVASSRVDEEEKPGSSPLEAHYDLALPIRVYPLFENAIRYRLGLDMDEHRRRLGLLCARMTQVAAANPYAWFRQARSAEEIVSVTPENRMICFPYTKYMNAILEVNQAACAIVTSVEVARELGIPQERWVFVWSGATLADIWFLSERPSLDRSLAHELVLTRALEQAGVSADQVDMFDFYSCFPSAVQAAMLAVGMQPDDPRPFTVTGGLPYAGGPGSNYSLHAIAAMVEALRSRPDAIGMVSSMGWYFTKHAAGVYSARPPAHPYRPYDPREDMARVEAQEGPPLLEEADGPGVVETYTIVYNREGQPEQGIVVGRMEGDSGGRFLAHTEPHQEVFDLMAGSEFVGRRGTVRHDRQQRRNLFYPD